ncbi:MAG: hypothetical protein QOI31_267 [Solirubrobacterales bacterium]|jgi:hypothetical protein|nr:hypothetical protein [Solirubrobacterales bacterium]
MPEIKDAVALVTDAANVSRMHAPGPEERFSVNQSRVIRGLRDAGAGKAEARELAFNAVEEVGGAVEIHASRGMAARGGKGDATDEVWWVPKSAVRF